MNDDIAIQVRGSVTRYTIGRERQPYRTPRGSIAGVRLIGANSGAGHPSSPPSDVSPGST